MSARERILARVRDAIEARPRTPHPGVFRGQRPASPPADPLDGFAALFTRAGGEVVRAADEDGAGKWLSSFAQGLGGVALEGVAVGADVPDSLRAVLPTAGASPEAAPLGVSRAVGAVAETGSLLLDARDGRRVQLLPPTHVVVVRASEIYPTLAEALRALRADLPSALALHSGPSKSADIGQILVTGVHGPGRVIALVISG